MDLPSSNGSYKNKCSVPGCTDKSSKRHRFPQDAELLKKWLKNINCEKLDGLDSKVLYRNKYICGTHFSEEMKVPGTKRGLRIDAIPTLYLTVSDTPVVADPDLQIIDLPENSLNPEMTLVSSTIDLFKDGSDPQLVDDFDLVRNLSSFGDKLFNNYDFKLPSSILPELRKKNDNSLQRTSKNEDQTELPSASVELEESVEDENLNDIEEQLSTDSIEVSTDKTSFTEKPHLKSVKCYLPGRSTNLTEFNTDKATFTQKPYFKSVKCYLPDSDTFAEVCRICFRSLIAEDVIKLYGEEISMEDETRLKHMLKLVLPDMDLEIYPNTVICKKCVELLESSYQLKEMWLSTETKLQKILEKKENVINREADLIILTEDGKNEASPGADAESDHNYAETSTNSKQQSEQKLKDSILRNLLDGSGNSFPKKMKIYHGELKTKNSTGTKPVSSQKRFTKQIWGRGPYMCEQCGCIFPHAQKLRRHLLLHKKEKVIKPKERKIMCEICGRLFLTSGSLMRHTQTHTGVDIEPKCSFCGKEFKHIRSLKTHTYYVHGHRSFQCHLCGKHYPYRTSLRSHLLQHDPSKKVHACNFCDKKFVIPSKLRRHLRMHTTGDKWTCDYCGKALKYENSFWKHVKTYHLNEGEFVCEFCNKPYWKKKALQQHRIRVHGCSSEVQKNVVLVDETNDCTNVPDYQDEL